MKDVGECWELAILLTWSIVSNEATAKLKKEKIEAEDTVMGLERIVKGEQGKRSELLSFPEARVGALEKVASLVVVYLQNEVGEGALCGRVPMEGLNLISWSEGIPEVFAEIYLSC